MLKLVEITPHDQGSTTVPSTFARPPEKGVPPTTTAAIAEFRVDTDLAGTHQPSLAVSTSPANPASRALII